MLCTVHMISGEVNFSQTAWCSFEVRPPAVNINGPTEIDLNIFYTGDVTSGIFDLTVSSQNLCA